MERLVKFDSVEKFKAIASIADTSSIFQTFFKKDFSENPVNLGWESGFNILQV